MYVLDKRTRALNFEATKVQSHHLRFGPVHDVLHVDGVLALVLALLFVFLLEYPLFADAEAAC